MTFEEIEQKYGKLTKMFNSIHGINEDGEHFTIQANKERTIYTISTIKDGKLYTEKYYQNKVGEKNGST